MALNIKSATVDRKARLLAQRTGESITTAIEKAVDERLRVVGGSLEAETRLAKWRARTAHLEPVPGGAGNWKEEFYDEFGLPR